MTKYAVACGEMFDGITFYGPFDDFESAEAYAHKHADVAWWVIRLENTESVMSEHVCWTDDTICDDCGTPTCDVCGVAQYADGSLEWNGDTGNHVQCEGASHE